jgi:hypothetical protein
MPRGVVTMGISPARLKVAFSNTTYRADDRVPGCAFRQAQMYLLTLV